MKYTNTILNATTSRNAKLVKYKDARKITQKKKKEVDSSSIYKLPGPASYSRVPVTRHNRGLEYTG